MIVAGDGSPVGAETRTAPGTEREDKVRRLVEVLPRPLRFLSVGALGLVCDMAVFTLLIPLVHPLGARVVSLAAATFVTWRLNRALTFDPSRRHPAEEAMRYAVVTASAQGTSYAIFACLVLTVLAAQPQLALIIGAANGAVISYTGHRVFAFAPRAAAGGSLTHQIGS